MGGRERGETENGTDAGNESRSKIYFDYAEQQGGKDREAGLKRETNIPPPRPPLSTLVVTKFCDPPAPALNTK